MKFWISYQSKQGAKFYARKKLAKKHIHSTDLELETKIMQNEEMNNFIGLILKFFDSTAPSSELE